MLTGKQKRYLRSIAMTMEPIQQIGKDGIGDNLIKQLDETIEVRELIKVKILKNSSEEVHDAGERLSQALKADLVQTIGHCIVLYRKSEKKPKLELPK
ncbi:MAG: ribosome assembly RNA-binding protein YhbY [Bacillota bacterium]|nr:ribosome assembly RNA-binding protein YhbY [Bacillota bacterium]